MDLAVGEAAEAKLGAKDMKAQYFRDFFGSVLTRGGRRLRLAVRTYMVTERRSPGP